MESAGIERSGWIRLFFATERGAIMISDWQLTLLLERVLILHKINGKKVRKKKAFRF